MPAPHLEKSVHTAQTPLPVLTACEKMTREIEANPDRFMRSTYIPILRDVRARVAKLIGAEADECVIVPNATHGVNTVLRNFDWNEGDIIVKSRRFLTPLLQVFFQAHTIEILQTMLPMDRFRARCNISKISTRP